MTDITTIGGLRAAVRSGPESLPLTIWCDGVQVRSCDIRHGAAGCEITLRTGKPTPTEAETLAEANSMGGASGVIPPGSPAQADNRSAAERAAFDAEQATASRQRDPNPYRLLGDTGPAGQAPADYLAGRYHHGAAGQTSGTSGDPK